MKIGVRWMAVAVLALAAASSAKTDRVKWRTNAVHGVAVDTWKVYPSRDKKLRAVVMRLKPVNTGQGEGVVEIRDARMRRVRTADYTSEGTQGYIVGQGTWTPDSRYFVFSTIQADGDHVVRFPTRFYDRARKQFFLLDSVCGVVDDDNFRVTAPSKVTVSVKHQPVTADLGRLSSRQRDTARREEMKVQRKLQALRPSPAARKREARRAQRARLQ